jgi:hypothetical protein
MITFSKKGDFSRLSGFLERAKNLAHVGDLDKYGRKGVSALQAATPKDTGLTAESWYYTIRRSDGEVAISFGNSNVQNGIPIVILIQYGHATRGGTFVEGVDFINPALKPIFRELANEVRKEVTRT